MSAKIFISYRRTDEPRARLLHTLLRERGVEAWYDALIGDGEDWRAATANALVQAPIFVLLLSRNASTSDDMVKELSAATFQKKQIIPVRIENVQPEGAFLYELASRNWFEAHEHTEHRLAVLADRLAALLAESATLTPTLTNFDIQQDELSSRRTATKEKPGNERARRDRVRSRRKKSRWEAWVLGTAGLALLGMLLGGSLVSSKLAPPTDSLGCIRGVQSPHAISMVVDSSAGTRDADARLLGDQIEAEIQNAAENTYFALYSSAGESDRQSNLLFERCLPRSGDDANFWLESSTSLEFSYRTKFQTPLLNAINVAIAGNPTPQRPIVETVVESAARKRWQGADQRLIIVFTDGAQNSRDLSIESAIRDNFNSYRSSDLAIRSNRLRDSTVRVVLFNRPGPPSLQKLIHFWQQWADIHNVSLSLEY